MCRCLQCLRSKNKRRKRMKRVSEASKMMKFGKLIMLSLRITRSCSFWEALMKKVLSLIIWFIWPKLSKSPRITGMIRSNNLGRLKFWWLVISTIQNLWKLPWGKLLMIRILLINRLSWIRLMRKLRWGISILRLRIKKCLNWDLV